jgi:hypothetical protein
MAIQISGTTVIDNSRNLANIATFDSTVTSAWDTVTVTATGKTLVNREYCTVTAAGQTITLPASPSAGWEVVVSVGDFTNTVVARNGSNIMGLAEDITLDKAWAVMNFLYTGASQGWRLY